MNNKELAQAIVNAWNKPFDNENNKQFNKRIGVSNVRTNSNECRADEAKSNTKLGRTKTTRTRV